MTNTLPTSSLCMEVNGVSKSFGEKVILNNISFQLHPEESIAVMGRSGEGKTTLFRCLLGLLKPDAGHITIHGCDVTTASKKQIRQALYSVGVLFQEPALFDELPLWKNVAFRLLQEKITSQKAWQIAKEKLALLDMGEETLSLYPSQLSGGMNKRASLARAIATDPNVLLFDEPTTGLDPITSSIVTDLMMRIITHTKASVIFVTHDLNSAMQIADKFIILWDGSIAWSGSKKDMQSTDDPYVRQLLEGRIDGPMSQRHRA